MAREWDGINALGINERNRTKLDRDAIMRLIMCT